ncbi:MAG: alpha/beta fold hydrolase [Thermotoga caldifontis]|uniref:alpha/beta fold hydrolase n=1 Tax=Thermotoga caldifontis TaxID=1508419 RepID=UPI003C7A9459
MKAGLVLSLVFLGSFFLLSLDPARANEGAKFLDRSRYFFETIDGVKIAYQKVGEGPETLILIHGFMGNSTNFEPIFDLLKDDFTLIAVDLPGFGLSEKKIEKNLSRRYMAWIVARLAERLGLEHYHVLGHSMGTEVATWLALNEAEKVKSLILLDSSICLPERNSVPGNTFTKIGLRLIFMNYDFQKRTFKDMLVNKESFSEEYFLKNYYLVYQTPLDIVFNLAENQDTAQLRENLKNLSVPTLIVWGEQDNITPLEGAKCLFEINARLVMIPNAGHLIMFDQPQILSETIKGFVFSSISNR